MALFKISKGLKANLPSTKTEGYCWYTTDDSLFYIDYKDENGTLQRRALNAKDAETLMGASLSTILNSSDVEIPTSKAVLDALGGKVDKISGKGLSTNDYTTSEKEKLANIESGANKTVVDTALSSTSTNPVQNKVINTKLSSMQSDIDIKVPNTRTVNGKALSSNITLSASDVGALPDTTTIPSIDGLATETYVDNKVASLVDSAPETLDTLNELAAALGDDPNFATTIATQIGSKVDKVDGKGLSTNDLTNTLKSNYDAAYTHSTSTHAPSDAEKNVIVGVQKNGTDVSVGSDRKVNITIPTSASDIGAASLADLQSHIENSDIHVTAEEKAAWSESDVFIATYGTTTNAEIEAAYQAGKAVYCLDKSTTPIGFYSLTRISTSGHYAYFDVAIGQDLSGIGFGKTVQAIRISCTQGTWNTTKYAAATSEHASAHASDGADPITPASIGAAPISTTTEVTLAAASWSGDSAPYTYTLTVNGVTDTSTQEIVFATSINLEQLTAGQNANIQDGGQSANTIVLKAWGEKPTVDLPIRVIMRG